MNTLPKPPLTTYIFKVAWDATALILKVEAPSYDMAERKLNNLLRRMEGGMEMKSITFLHTR